MTYAKNRKATIKGTPVIVRNKIAGEGESYEVWTIDPHAHEQRGEMVAESYSSTDASSKIRAAAIAEAKTRL